MLEFAEKIQNLCEHGQAFVSITLVGIRGSAPQVEGAKMIVTEEGLYWGTVGGGKIEAHCIRKAQQLLLERGETSMFTWNLQKDIGMTCGGEVKLFFDVHIPENWTIAIFGAGHLSQELVRVMSSWDARVIVVDSRKEWIAKLPKAPHIKTYCMEKPEEIVEQLPEKAFIISMTKGHSSDVPILEKALKNYEKFSMIGVIGSDQKAMRIKEELITRGVTQLQGEHLISPLGLPIGNNKPFEIAISISAQILAVRDGIELNL